MKKPFAGAQTVRQRGRYWPLKLRGWRQSASAAGFVLIRQLTVVSRQLPDDGDCLVSLSHC